MISKFKRLRRDRRGNILAIAGAALPLVVGAAGLATDTIQWTLWKRQLQRAADSAALAGVYERVEKTGGTSTVEATVNHDLSLNLHTQMGVKTGYPQLSYPANTAAMTNQVEVKLAVQQRLPFSSMFLRSAPTITTTARAAAVITGGDACFHALETGSVTGLNFTGNSTIEAPDCEGFSNSTGTNASVAKGSSSVHLKSVGAVGGVQQSNNFHVTAYRPYSPALSDPFKNVNPNPSDMKCAGHWQTKKGVSTWVYDALDHTTDMAAAKAQDGSKANCWTEMSVGSNKTLTVPDNFGPIYLDANRGSGNATVQGNLSCLHCTIVLTNSNTSATTVGTIKVNAGSNNNITAPTTGTFAGIAIYQDRRAQDCNVCNKVNGNSGSQIKGAIYFPSQELEYNGTGNTVAICTMFVARRLNFSGNSSISNKFKELADCADVGLPSNSSSVIVRLVG